MSLDALTDDEVSGILAGNVPWLRRFLTGVRVMPSGAPAITDHFGRDDPRDFARDILGLRPTPAALARGYVDGWTPDQDRVLVSVRDHRRTLVPSGHGTGKTWIAAVIALSFLYSTDGAIVVTTAPTARQVEELLWAEIRQAWARSKTKLPGRMLTTKLEIAEKWYAIGFTASPAAGDISATTFQGFHGPRVLVLFDEAVGVAEEILQGAEGIAVRPDDRIVAIFNPTDPASWAVRAMRDPRWNVVHLDCRNHPNVIHNDPDIVPGAVTAEWVADRLVDYGSEDSPLFKSKVAGLPPDQSSDSLISLGWIEAAQKKWGEPVTADDRRGVAIGIDVAGEGGDLTVAFAIEQGRAFLPFLRGRRAWHQGRDLEHAVDLAIALTQEYNVRAMAIDDTGIGQGLTARLRRMQGDGKLPGFYIGPTDKPGGKPAQREMWIVARNFASSADDPTFSLAKDEILWNAREVLRRGELILPDDAELAKYALPRGSSFIQQLTVPLYDATGTGGRVRVYDKRGAHGSADKTRTLPTSSPDLLHAFALCVDAWRRLKPTAAAPARNVEEVFEARTLELMKRGQDRERERRRAREGIGVTLPPWRRAV